MPHGEIRRGMTLIDICVLVAGMGAIVAGCTGNTFYWGSRYGVSNTKMPTWLGRTMFIGVGFVFLLIELKRAWFDSR
jgi:hypothetical protein